MNIAKPDAMRGSSHRPVWESDADAFFNKPADEADAATAAAEAAANAADAPTT